MSEAYSGPTPAATDRLGVSRAFVIIGMLLFSMAYTGLTLFGSWDFLFKSPDVVQLNSATRAPITADGIGAYGSVLSLPDDWRTANTKSKSWRYRLVFDIAFPPVLDREVYLPYIADSAKITINGVPQPYFGQLGEQPDFHWSVPLLFPVNASAFRLGKNELLVDVYSNESELGALSTIAIGPRGAFETHKSVVYATKRGMALALLVVDIFAIFAFAFFAATKSGQFYFVSSVLCVSLLGCLLPHLQTNPLGAIGGLFTFVIISFLVMMSCMVYMCSVLFEIDKKVLKYIYGLNLLNIFLHVAVFVSIDSFSDQKHYFIFFGLLIQLAGLTCTWLLIKRFVLAGEFTIGVMLFFALMMAALGIRDMFVLWGFLPTYSGYYTLHCVALLAICLMIIVAIRIRDGSREQAQFHNSMHIALINTRQAIDQSRNKSPDSTVDALVSRIATTYSHEFRNPLAAALATTKTMHRLRWEKNGHDALLRIDQSIDKISDALNQQFDFHRAMQSTEINNKDLTATQSLSFLEGFPSCKIVWLSDPVELPQKTRLKIQEWLNPYLEEFGRIPSVCMVRWQSGEVILHLYLYLNKSDLVYGRSVDQGALEHLNPQRLEDFGEGHYLYWHHAFS